MLNTNKSANIYILQKNLEVNKALVLMAKGGEARVRRADQPAKFDGERVDAYVEFLVRTNFRDQQQ